MVANAVFTINGLRKSFGPIEVLGGIDLALAPGQVTVLMGANGAGKSTLVKIMSGVYTRSSGTMELAGRPFAPATPAEAIRAGVVTVHQSINDGVVADLDVATNLTLDRLSGTGSKLMFNPGRVRREARAVAERVGLDIDMKKQVRELSLADRQMVSIARAMAHEPQVLVLDEPTSSLSSAEAERLFALVDRLRDRGVAILYISHRMSDIRRVADTIVSLRDGVITGTFDTEPLDYEGAVNAMLGRRIDAGQIEARAATGAVLSAKGLRIAEGAEPFDLELGAGEIVAVTGLVGVGKTALAETLFGLRTPLGGTMTLGGKPYAPRAPGKAIEQGVFLLAKDRASSGIVHDFDIGRNISLPFLRGLSAGTIMQRGAEQQRARDQIAALNIVCRGERDEMSALSGGNQQKVMVARWMAEPARVFILDEPFQGVDISARRDMAAKLRASAQGRATLVFLTELDEVFEIADRILVMSEHTIVGAHRNGEIDFDRLLSQIAGDGAAQAAATTTTQEKTTAP
ncbi:sugar ABC transporter ATP-binding protein [Pelagibacterium montanilacus]|uniref:sugar ABC transporter ATP-binding protein n=1 Tax=Pelagibacterium montanilacus TaxID=2185280 RepID=UPI000F8C79B4|nr:sugar ABC transporter ATP-binding protein [Pelagibacterium montanilacus]